MILRILGILSNSGKNKKAITSEMRLLKTHFIVIAFLNP
jgi:hypothetical protein